MRIERILSLKLFAGPPQERLGPRGGRLGRFFRAGGAALLATLLLPPQALAGLNLQNWSTPQGARVYFVENHELPMLDISVDFDAGSARDSREKSGLASLTRHAMTLGAGTYDERDISEKMADVGANLGGRLDADRAGFQVRTLSGKAERDQTLDLLAAILAVPRFDASILEREKARVIAALQEAETLPEHIGEKAFQAAIYGDHPYALNESGEVATVAKLSRSDLVAFHRAYYRAHNMVIAVMGDINRAEAEALAEKLAMGLPPGAAPAPLPPVKAVNDGKPGGKQQVIPHHATQSHLFMGLPGLQREDADYFPLYVGNYILGGGGFDSRLTKAIRDKKGLAYSVYSYFMPMRELGPFQIGLQTRRQATDDAVDSARAEVERYLKEGPSEVELTQAKNNLIGGFPMRIDSNKKILEYLAMIGFYRLPLDWLDTYTARVDAVSRDDILRAFRARVRPAAMSTVIVGGQIDAAGK
ncbi:MAG: peptidase M16 [Hydrogenophilales bacterium CG17_big_fil_post_rev_8_21_14_2_50_63_12]|nr:MAG: peptidase M16 [Hydrogenophilales bacterium CG17_big_fil_post_rev_8_21_14_2_50_63_12]PIX96131.1 MAG: peptidase M16 [Hydrogenophilales bacterium CG_4_10_14_3_um_filter_63_21]PJB04608.1 MAG: peptidase M16 [Hydrogenophilales bacterium CG_4_9_14_3_um_filter_63_34]